MPGEPILTGVRTIRHTDALIDSADNMLERDENGQPMSLWDGVSFKRHPVRDRLVPDETGRKELYQYVKPSPARWSAADLIVGNPPFIGSKRMREQLGDGYFDAVRAAYPKLSGDIDFVYYWWACAAQIVAGGGARRAGLITTNTLRQIIGQGLLRTVLRSKKPASLVFAVADHPWRDAHVDAAVRVSMTVLAAGELNGTTLEVEADGAVVSGSDRSDRTNEDLTITANATEATALKVNEAMSFMGVKLAGAGFRQTGHERAALMRDGAEPSLLALLVTGSDITGHPQGRYVIDLFGMSEVEAAEPLIYQHLVNTVLPVRRTLKRKAYRDNWCIFAEPRPAMRKAIARLERVIVTSEVSKHSTFLFHDTVSAQFYGAVIVIASADAHMLGYLRITQRRTPTRSHARLSLRSW